MKLHAKTLAGLEDLVAQDMKQAGATEVSVGRRGVSCLADLKTMYHLCLHSRFVLRVLRHLTEFDAKNPDDLYRQCARFAWEDLIPVDGTFVVDATVHSEVFTHDHFAALRLKDAVVDRFRGKTGQRPSIDRVRPDVRLHLHIAGNKVTLSVDATGAPLSHRGYRPPQAKAPLNEVLAAGLLALSGWRPGTPLIDPMCGSGTFSTEAALWASGLPVQAGRRQFAFMKWSDFDASAWREVRDESMHEVKAVDTLIWASDNHPGAIRQTRHSLEEADVDGMVQVSQSDFFNLHPPTDSGAMVMNPTYGEGIDPGNAVGMYEGIGERLKFNCAGFDAWVISSNEEALKRVGLRPHKRIPVFNGGLPCKWVGFQMYKGKKSDQHKRPS